MSKQKSLTKTLDSPDPQSVKEPEVSPVQITEQEKEKAFKTSEMVANSIDSLAAKLDDFKEAPVVPPLDEVKKKRGRKPGSKNEQKVPIENFTPKPEQQVFAGAVISGVILLTIVDAFIPWLIVAFHNKYKKNKMTAKELQLPADIKKELGAVADEVIKTSNLKISPATALFFSLIAAYGTAYMAASTKKPTQAEMKVTPK